MNVDYSGYEGWPITGKIEHVLLRGALAIENQELRIPKGYGRFVKRNKVSKVV
jgi:dihydropyrimidinase